jgi:hypothetical protein
MAILIKSVEGEILTEVVGSLVYYKPIIADIQTEDYINLNGFTAYLQNLLNAEETSLLTKPLKFGLKNQYNKNTITLEVSY